MKNILIIHHGKGIGGALVALAGLIDELKFKHNVTVFSIFDGVAVDYLRKRGVEVVVATSFFYKKFYSIFIHSKASYASVFGFFIDIKSIITYFFSKYFFASRELIRVGKNFDLIYLNSTFISDWAPAAKATGRWVFMHVREPISFGIFGFRYGIIQRSISKYCDHIIAVSFDNSKRLNLEFKTTVIYDPVVTTGRDFHTSVELVPNCKYFVYVGGESRIKGFEQFVNSLCFLREDIRVFFLGAEVSYSDSIIKNLVRIVIDPFFSRYRKLKNTLIDSPNVVLIGLTDDVFSYLKNSLFLVSPFSKPHAALPVLEAFSVGLPVIVSDVEGMSELVDENKGFFFRNGSPIELANIINDASLIDSLTYRILSENCNNAYIELRKCQCSVLEIVDTVIYE